MSTNKHIIPVASAAAMIRRYRASRPENFAICETFEKDAVIALLSNSECQYLRIYYGMSEEQLVHAILVGVNAAGEDILPSGDEVSVTTAEDEGLVLEDGLRCPKACPPESALNT